METVHFEPNRSKETPLVPAVNASRLGHVGTGSEFGSSKPCLGRHSVGCAVPFGGILESTKSEAVVSWGLEGVGGREGEEGGQTSPPQAKQGLI